MTEFIKTIVSAIKTWVKGLIKESTADWNQNDAETENYVKNRTHYEEVVKQIMVNENLDFSNCETVNWGQTKVGYLYEDISLSLIVGDEYDVCFDGVTYSCKSFMDGEFDNVVIGNGAFVADCNEDNGLPFAVGNYSSGETYAYVIVADQNAHAISVATSSTVVHKLDKKYLPDGISPQSDWNQNDVNKEDYIKNRTHYTGFEESIKIPEITVSSWEEKDEELNSYRCFIEFTDIEEELTLYEDEGKPYFVIFDGIKYDCLVWDGDEVYGIGKSALCGNRAYSNDDIPFCAILFSTSGFLYAKEPGDHSFVLGKYEEVVYKLDEKYIPDSIARSDIQEELVEKVSHIEEKMDKENPVGTGSFVINGLDGKSVGENSFTAGQDSWANGARSTAIGYGIVSGEDDQTVFGKFNKIEPIYEETTAANISYGLTLNGYYNVAASYEFDEITGTFALIDSKRYSISSSNYTGYYACSGTTYGQSHIFKIESGTQTIGNERKRATRTISAVKLEPKYVHMVGNGTSAAARSNAHTLDWSGNAWFAGDVYIGGAGQDDDTVKKLATVEQIDEAIAEIPEVEAIPDEDIIALFSA